MQTLLSFDANPLHEQNFRGGKQSVCNVFVAQFSASDVQVQLEPQETLFCPDLFLLATSGAFFSFSLKYCESHEGSSSEKKNIHD